MPETRMLTYGGAVNAALERVLTELPSTVVYGEDVAKPGGVFGATRGLRRKFGERVFDTPISESAILGSALGAAMFGRRPIVEIMWADFSLVALDQIVNQIANARYVSRGRVSAPIVIRTQQGTASGACAQHSQSLEAFFLHTPGLRVAMPTTPQDAYDVLLSATYCDDPVVVIENRTLYAGAAAEVRIGDAPRSVGGTQPRRRGSDVTVVSWGAITRSVEAAADAALAEGLSTEVIEASWLNPFDWQGVLQSVSRTRRLLVVHEANLTAGFGAEVLAQVAESGIELRAVPARLAAPDIRVPAAPPLVDALIPSTAKVHEQLHKLATA